jgi:hypothetical protein
MATVRSIPSSERDQLSRLLNPRLASDATAAYYALTHPGERVRLLAYCPGDGPPTGFLALARTGFDLFRPLAIPFVAHAAGLAALLKAGLSPSEPVILCLPVGHREWAEAIVEMGEGQTAELLRLDPSALEPIINVLVETSLTPDGEPRYEIRSRQEGRVSAGVNWRGEHFAEVYVEVETSPKVHGFTRSVLAAMAGQLLRERKIPLLRVTEEQPVVRAEALQLGYKPTGVRMDYAQAQLRQDPGQS